MDIFVLQRRHKEECPDKHKGVTFLKCKGRCRFYAYRCEGKRERVSLKTSDYQRASKKIAELNEAGKAPDTTKKKLVVDAVAEFLKHKGNREGETIRKYRRHLKLLTGFCEQRGLTYMPELTIEALDPYEQLHRCARIGWHKHVEQLRAFFRFCEKRKWIDDNTAFAWELPELEEPEEIVPYTRGEVAEMIAACWRVGKLPYERLRAYGMVVTLRYTGMRISDVVTLSREHIQGKYIVKRAIKNKRWLKIEIAPAVRQALENLPRPAAASADSQIYFAGGGTLRSLVKGAERLLASVFKLSKVEGAFPHRFRHTFATELLAKHTPIEVVADLLGDSVEVVRKHYKKWCPEWQGHKDQASRKLLMDEETPHGAFLSPSTSGKLS